MMRKTCSRCDKEKPLDDFGKDRAKKDGHRSECKECAGEDYRQYHAKNHRIRNAQSRAWYALNREYVRDRAGSVGNRKVNNAKAKAWRLANPDKVRVQGLSYRRRYPERTRAGTAVTQALKSGGLIRPNKCSCCGKVGKVQAHHPSYAKMDWLKVVWLSVQCHKKLHAVLAA